ncbi:MAG: hypothetical protein AAFX55_02560 [Bacteroidota bacterium]
MKFSIEKLLALPMIYIGVLSLLDFFFKDYNDLNKFELSLISYIIIFCIVLLIVMGFVLRHSQEKDDFIKIAKSFAYGVFFGFVSVLYIGMVKDQTAFYLNKIYAKNSIEEYFEVTHKSVIDNDNVVGLKAVNSRHWFSTENKFSNENLIYIQENDTIRITYAIGLLNQPFLPYGKLEIIK